MAKRIGQHFKDRDSLAKRFKEWRQEFNFNPKEAAAALGVNISSYYNLEGGRTLPSAETLAELADAYQVNLNWLLVGKGEMLKRFKTSSPFSKNWEINLLQ